MRWPATMEVTPEGALVLGRTSAPYGSGCYATLVEPGGRRYVTVMTDAEIDRLKTVDVTVEEVSDFDGARANREAVR